MRAKWENKLTKTYKDFIQIEEKSFHVPSPLKNMEECMKRGFVKGKIRTITRTKRKNFRVSIS
jgi:hypothetical protein